MGSSATWEATALVTMATRRTVQLMMDDLLDAPTLAVAAGVAAPLGSWAWVQWPLEDDFTRVCITQAMAEARRG